MSTTTPRHSVWFYIGWTIAVIILVPIVLFLVRFAYVEYQLQQAKQDLKSAIQQQQAIYQQQQNEINASENQ